MITENRTDHEMRHFRGKVNQKGSERLTEVADAEAKTQAASQARATNPTSIR